MVVTNHILIGMILQEENVFAQEVQADQTLPIGRIGNPCSMDHPKDQPLCLVLDFQGLSDLGKRISCCFAMDPFIQQKHLLDDLRVQFGTSDFRGRKHLQSPIAIEVEMV